MGKIYEFDVDKKYPHENHATTLLVPRGENGNTQRFNMFGSHQAQFVQLCENDFPLVFTNFEIPIGQASTNGYKKAKEDFIVLKRFDKNQYQYDLLIQYKYSKEYDIIHFRNYDHIGAVSESYGTRMIEGSAIHNAKSGTEVKAGSYLSYTPSYTEDGRFAYGRNLRAVYTSWDGLNHEDAIVLTETAAEKLKSYKVLEIPINIGTNNIFLDLYNTDNSKNTYHSFPHVGEYTKGTTLVASRQKNNKTLLFEFQQERMKKIQKTDRRIVCPENSLVVDIDVYTSKTPEELRAMNDMFMNEIADVLEEQNNYWEDLKLALEEIIPVATNEQLESIMSESEKMMFRGELENFKTQIDRPLPIELNDKKYSEELGYYWKLAHEYCNRKIKWKEVEGTVIQNIELKFTLLKEDPVSVGLKLTGRYGNKGVVSQIIRDDEAPIDEYGRPVEIILNPYGVNNRMNWSQCFEQHINFMSEHVIQLMKETESYSEKQNILFTYLRMLVPEQYYFFKKLVDSFNNGEEIVDFYNSIETDGIYIHQYPYYGNAEAHGAIKNTVPFDDYKNRISTAKKNKDKEAIYREYLAEIDKLNPEIISDEDIDFGDKTPLWNDIKDKLVPLSGYETNEEINYFDYFYNNHVADIDKKRFWEDIEENGPLLKPNLTTIVFEHPEWCTKYKCDGIELPQVIGAEYFIRLKHEASNHSSMRNAETISPKELPLKTSNNKLHKNVYANTPNKIGRMELNNLLITNDPKTINKFLRTYSTCKEDRQTLIRALLTANNPFEIKSVLCENKSIPRSVLDEYLKVLDLELTDIGGDNNE